MKLKKPFLAAAAIVVSTLAYASPAYDSHTIYYSDETHTVMVGDKYLSCSGRVYLDGVVTPYSEIRIGSKC